MTYEEMKRAVNRYFDDTSRTQGETREGLENLVDVIRERIDAAVCSCPDPDDCLWGGPACPAGERRKAAQSASDAACWRYAVENGMIRDGVDGVTLIWSCVETDT